MRLGQTSDAEKLLVKACNLKTSDRYTSALLYYALGVNRLKQNKLSLAEKDLRRSLSEMEAAKHTSGKEFTAALDALSAVLEKQGRMTEAEVLRNTVSESVPAAPFVFNDVENDADRAELVWDRWRNRLLYAIAFGLQSDIDHLQNEGKVRFKGGTIVWFSCRIAKNGTVINAEIFQSSGIAQFYQLTINSIRALSGTSYLKFPPMSKREFISQMAACRLNSQGKIQPLLPPDRLASIVNFVGLFHHYVKSAALLKV